jgi:hypothetical protein
MLCNQVGMGGGPAGMRYLTIAAIIVGLAILAISLTGGVAAIPLIGLLRLFPAIASFISAFAVALLVIRLGAYWAIAAAFCIPTVLIGMTQFAQVFGVGFGAPRFLHWVFWLWPILTVIPAFALLHLAKSAR